MRPRTVDELRAESAVQLFERLLLGHLRESVHSVRAPLINRGAQLFTSALRKQRNGFIRRAKHHLGLFFKESGAAKYGMLQYFRNHPDRDDLGLLESSASEISAILSQLPPIQIKPTVDRVRTNAGIAGGNQTAAMLGMSPFSKVPQRVKDYIAEHSLEQVGRDLDETTVKELRTILVKGLEEEKPFSTIITEIKQAGVFSRDRAETIAVTEIGNAFSQGTLGIAKDLVSEGLDMEKSWLAEDDPCDICAGNSDADWIDVDEDFPSGDDAPLAHVNCLCALLVRRSGSEE